MNRPTTVTVVAWVIIAMAIQAVITSLTSFAQAALANVIDGPVPISTAVEIGSLFQVAIAVFAAFMLRGASWARIAFVVLSVFIILAMIPATLRHSALIGVFFIYILKLAVFCYFLFGRDASAYFHPESKPAIQEAGE